MSCISVSCLNSRYRVVCVIINDRRSVLDLVTFGGEFQIDLLMFISRNFICSQLVFPSRLMRMVIIAHTSCLEIVEDYNRDRCRRRSFLDTLHYSFNVDRQTHVLSWNDSRPVHQQGLSSSHLGDSHLERSRNRSANRNGLHRHLLHFIDCLDIVLHV